MNLNGKTAVVTGGSRGIGRAVCIALAQAGANVILLYAGNAQKAEETLALLDAYPGKAAAFCCDVSDFAQTKEIFSEIHKAYGAIDIVVNNAGITKDKLMLSMKPEEFEAVLNINLTGAFNVLKQVYPIMAKQRSGKIINISSVAGLMGNAGQVNYAASKAGLIGMTKSIAKELAPRGICCNAIAPGFIETDMTEAFRDKPEVLDAIPMKRMGKPEEVAALVAFLASPAADYITGEVIRIDGGMAM